MGSSQSKKEAEERRLAEQRRLEEERRLTERRRLEETRRLLEQHRLAEERRIAQQREADAIATQKQYDEELTRIRKERAEAIKLAEIQRAQHEQELRRENQRQQYEKEQTKPVEIDPDLFNLSDDIDYDEAYAVSYIMLDKYFDDEYKLVNSKISNRKNFIIDNIEKVENPCLKKAYQLKKEQKTKQFPELQEQLLFHGTSEDVVDEICTFNFDWRYVKEHKFGKGISFSKNSTYSSVYSDESYDKVMLVCKVLVGNCCPGNRTMEIPDDEYDTSVKSTREVYMDDIVTVKFEDNEFYPAYKIYYHLLEQKQKRITTNNPGRRF